MIKELEVKNFTVFKNAKFAFGNKLNIIIGENGSGKTQLIKLLYALLLGSMRQKDSISEHLSLRDVPMAIRQNLEAVFHTKMENLINANGNSSKNMSFAYCYCENDKQTKVFHEWSKKKIKLEKDGNTPAGGEWLEAKPIFIPAHEVLTIYPNFISVYDKYLLEYDSTYRNLVSDLGVPALKEKTNEYVKIIKNICNAINADIFLDVTKNRFYLKQKSLRRHVEIDMAAEGWRRLGMILQLLRNGALHCGVSLFWDEPEANLNPKLIKIIAEVIFELSCENHIQMFITTHSLFLLRELEYLSQVRKLPESIRYFVLHNGEVEQSESSADLTNIASFEAEIDQEDRVLAFDGGNRK